MTGLITLTIERWNYIVVAFSKNLQKIMQDMPNQ